jgi:endoglucanase
MTALLHDVPPDRAPVRWQQRDPAAVLPTLNTSADPGPVSDLAATIKQLNDPNIIATVHHYGHWPFSANHAGTVLFDEQSVKRIHDSFDNVYNAFVAKAVPVIIGEYGTLRGRVA